jgi:hypothetical protein
MLQIVVNYSVCVLYWRSMPGPWTSSNLQVESLRPSQSRTRLSFGLLAENKKVTEAAGRALCVIELMTDGGSIDRLSEDLTIHRATG